MMESVFAGLNFPQKVVMTLELAFLIGMLVNGSTFDGRERDA